MPVALTLALAFAAQSAAAAPPAAPAKAPAAAPAPAPVPAGGCKRSWPDANTREIIVCAERSTGYRINADVLGAARMKRPGGRPSRPNGAGVKDTSACAVGAHPMGCQSAGINIIGVALTAAQMAARLAQGKEIGSMFVTDPQMSDYQLYLAAKAAREAEEAAAKATAEAKAAAPATAATGPAPATTAPPPAPAPSPAR